MEVYKNKTENKIVAVFEKKEFDTFVGLCMGQFSPLIRACVSIARDKLEDK